MPSSSNYASRFQIVLRGAAADAISADAPLFGFRI